MSKKDNAAKKAAAKPVETKVEEVKVEEVATKPTTKDVKVEAKKEPTQETAKVAKPKKEKVATVIAETVEDTASLAKATGIPLPSENINSMKRSSADTKAKLVDYGFNRFIKDEQFKENYPERWKHITQVCDVTWLLAMVDIRNEIATMQAEGSIIAKIPEDQLMPLTEVADMLGITLAAPKALIGPNGEKQLAIDFNSPETKIPEELKEERPTVEEIPELDYAKVGTDHELICAALNYLMHENRNIAKNIDKTVDWYRNLCLNNASGDEKLKLADKAVDYWIDEIFHLIPMASLLRGLGQSVYVYTKMQSSPLVGHSLLHGQLPKWSDDDIARLVKCLIQENYRYATDSPKVDANGNPKPVVNEKPTENKAIQATMGNLGTPYIDKLMKDLTQSVPENATDEQLEAIKTAREEARKIMCIVRANYYPKEKEPTNDQLRYAVGKILNSYRDPMDQMAEFEGPLPQLVGEYPDNTEKKVDVEVKVTTEVKKK